MIGFPPTRKTRTKSQSDSGVRRLVAQFSGGGKEKRDEIMGEEVVCVGEEKRWRKRSLGCDGGDGEGWRSR